MMEIIVSCSPEGIYKHVYTQHTQCQVEYHAYRKSNCEASQSCRQKSI